MRRAERVFLDRVGELDVVIEGIVDMQAAVAPGGGVEALGLQRTANLAFIPIGNRVADMVDHGLRRLRRIGPRIVHDEEIATLVRTRTEGEIGAALSLVIRYLHAERRAIEVACLRIIGAEIGNMIDAERLEPAPGWCGVRFRSACGENGSGDAKRLTEFAAA